MTKLRVVYRNFVDAPKNPPYRCAIEGQNTLAGGMLRQAKIRKLWPSFTTQSNGNT